MTEPGYLFPRASTFYAKLSYSSHIAYFIYCTDFRLISIISSNAQQESEQAYFLKIVIYTFNTFIMA